jgi:UDP-glucose 4-epimerase
MGWEVLAFCRGQRTSRLTGVTPIQADLASGELAATLAGLGEGIQAIFHFGAQLPAAGVTGETYVRTNALATSTLLDFAVAAGVSDFVYASTIGHIGSPRVLPVDESHPVSPIHPYFASKFCGELLCEHVRETTDINVSSLRITSPYGAGMKTGTVLPLFVERALKAQPITVHGQGSRTQNFVYGPDVAKAAISLLGMSGGICNVAGPKAISMLELADIVSRLAPGDSAVTLSGAADPLEEQRWEVSSAKLERLTGYAPGTRPEEGIRRYMNWLSAPTDDWWWAER